MAFSFIQGMFYWVYVSYGTQPSDQHQFAVCNIVQKHENLFIELYVHELASLTHIFFLCKINIARLLIQ